MVNNTIADEVYVLFQCGADAPPEADFPEGTKFFRVPLTSISAPETVPYSFVVSRAGRRMVGSCTAVGSARWCMQVELLLQLPLPPWAPHPKPLSRQPHIHALSSIVLPVSWPLPPAGAAWPD